MLIASGLFAEATLPCAANDNRPPAMSSEEVERVVRETANRKGIEPDEFGTLVRIESNFNQYAYNRTSGAAGPLQFLTSTARQYKLLNRYDVEASAEAGADLWNDNRRFLQKHNIDTSGGNMYLAHQQGALGAVRLLSNPNRKAYEIIGQRAVTLNGGSVSMTSGEFASIWIDKFNKMRKKSKN